LVLGYNPQTWQIVKATKGEAVDKLARALIEPNKERVVLSLPSLSPQGESFSAGQEVKLVTLKVTPKTQPAAFDFQFKKGTKLVPIKGEVVYQDGGYLSVSSQP
jgi:hypothetical protein